MINQAMVFPLQLDDCPHCAINRIKSSEKLNFIGCIAKNRCVNSIHMPVTRALNAMSNLYFLTCYK